MLHFGRLMWALALVSIFGCSTTTEIYQVVRKPSEDTGLVYFIRKSYPPYAWACDLKVNGVTVAKVANNTYAAVNVPVGRSSIRIDFTRLQGGQPFEFELESRPHETRYIVLTGDVSSGGVSVSGGVITSRNRWSLRSYEVDEATANRLMRELSRL